MVEKDAVDDGKQDRVNYVPYFLLLGQQYPDEIKKIYQLNHEKYPQYAVLLQAQIFKANLPVRSHKEEGIDENYNRGFNQRNLIN